MIFHGVIRSGNLLVLEFLPGKEQSRISHFQALNTLRKLNFRAFALGSYKGVHSTSQILAALGNS